MSLKSLFSARDMTQGAPWKRICEFAIPMLLGNIAQQLYNTVDSIVVGHYIGDSALAAVGSASPILNMLLVLFIGISTGANIMVSQYFGARRQDDLNATIGTSLTLTLIASAITAGIVTMLIRVVPQTIPTDISTSRRNFAANMVTIAAAGAEDGMTTASIISRSSECRHGHIAAVTDRDSIIADARCAIGERATVASLAPAR